MTSFSNTSFIALTAALLGFAALSTPAAANELDGRHLGHGPVVSEGDRGMRLHCDVFGASCNGGRDHDGNRDHDHDRDWRWGYGWGGHGYYGWGYPWSYGYYHSYGYSAPYSSVEITTSESCPGHMHFSPRYQRCIDNYN